MIREETKTRMREIVARYPLARSAMLPCLHLAQEDEGQVTPEGIAAVAAALGVKPDEVESVVTFYTMYHQVPLGRSVIQVCTSISCYLRGCDDLMTRLATRLSVKPGETTTDGRFTLQGVECLAACGMAPALQVNGDFVENVTPERAELLIGRLERGEPLGDLISRWRPMGHGGYTSADGVAPDGIASNGAAPSNGARDAGASGASGSKSAKPRGDGTKGAGGTDTQGKGTR